MIPHLQTGSDGYLGSAVAPMDQVEIAKFYKQLRSLKHVDIIVRTVKLKKEYQIHKCCDVMQRWRAFWYDLGIIIANLLDSSLTSRQRSN